MQSANDLSRIFQRRLDLLGMQHAPAGEIAAAVHVYERMKTAKAICDSLLPAAYSEAAVVAVLNAISAEVHHPGPAREPRRPETGDARVLTHEPRSGPGTHPAGTE